MTTFKVLQHESLSAGSSVERWIFSGPIDGAVYVLETDPTSLGPVAAHVTTNDGVQRPVKDSEAALMYDLADQERLAEIRRDHPVYQVVHAGLKCLGGYIEDLASGLEDGTYDDNDSLERAEDASRRIDVIATRLCAEMDAAAIAVRQMPPLVRRMPEYFGLAHALAPLQIGSYANDAPDDFTLEGDGDVRTAIADGFGHVQAHLQEFKSGLEDGVYDDRKGYQRDLQAAQKSFAALRRLAVMHDAAKKLVRAVNERTELLLPSLYGLSKACESTEQSIFRNEPELERVFAPAM